MARTNLTARAVTFSGLAFRLNKNKLAKQLGRKTAKPIEGRKENGTAAMHDVGEGRRKRRFRFDNMY